MSETNPEPGTLESINSLLKTLHTEIKTYCERTGKSEVALFIEDKHKSPSRKQVEDIESDVTDMRMMSR